MLSIRWLSQNAQPRYMACVCRAVTIRAPSSSEQARAYACCCSSPYRARTHATVNNKSGAAAGIHMCRRGVVVACHKPRVCTVVSTRRLRDARAQENDEGVGNTHAVRRAGTERMPPNEPLGYYIRHARRNGKARTRAARAQRSQRRQRLRAVPHAHRKKVRGKNIMECRRYARGVAFMRAPPCSRSRAAAEDRECVRAQTNSTTRRYHEKHGGIKKDYCSRACGGARRVAIYDEMRPNQRPPREARCHAEMARRAARIQRRAMSLRATNMRRKRGECAEENRKVCSLCVWCVA